jgi:hypothetical protein
LWVQVQVWVQALAQVQNLSEYLRKTLGRLLWVSVARGVSNDALSQIETVLDSENIRLVWVPLALDAPPAGRCPASALGSPSLSSAIWVLNSTLQQDGCGLLLGYVVVVQLGTLQWQASCKSRCCKALVRRWVVADSIVMSRCSVDERLMSVLGSK